MSQNKLFCSRICLYEYNKTEEGLKAKSLKIETTKNKKGTSGKVTKHCKQCNNTFTALKSETKSFCTKECRYEFMSENKDSMLQKQHQTNEHKYGYKFPTKNNKHLR